MIHQRVTAHVPTADSDFRPFAVYACLAALRHTARREAEISPETWAAAAAEYRRRSPLAPTAEPARRRQAAPPFSETMDAARSWAANASPRQRRATAAAAIEAMSAEERERLIAWLNPKEEAA